MKEKKVLAELKLWLLAQYGEAEKANEEHKKANGSILSKLFGKK